MKVKSEPFRVFEAGAGKHPFDLVKKAVRSINLKKNREFTGVDYELTGYNLESALRKMGIAKKPSNLRTYARCAIKEAEKLPVNSQNIIFAGLVVHQIVLQNLSYIKGVADAKRFLHAAKKALKPNGRIVLIQHLKDKEFFEKMAKEEGLIPYIRELTEKEALNSESIFLRQIATQEARKELLMNTLKQATNKPAKAVEIEDLAKARGVNPYDLHKPILIVLHKSK